MSVLLRFCQIFGLHPLVGFGVFAIDWMLFVAEAGTLGITWSISCAVAAALAVASLLIQRHSMKEEWGLAVGKGLLIGVLTAIPTALPSVLPFVGGVLGTGALLLTRKNHKDSGNGR